MNRRIVFFITGLFIPQVLCADIWDNSSCSLYIIFYFFSVVPVLTWIANLVVFILTFRQKRVNVGLFWLVNVISLCLALFSLLPVLDDTAHRHNRFDDYGLVLILCVLVPAGLSVGSIFLRDAQLYAKKQLSTRNVDQPSAQMEEPLVTPVDALTNNDLYKELSDQVIDTLPDDALLQAVLDNLAAKQAAGAEKEYDTVLRWNTSRQALYIISAWEGEVNNGGLGQFYLSSAGQFYKQLPGALRLIGANKFADLAEQANSLFENNKEHIAKYKEVFSQTQHFRTVYRRKSAIPPGGVCSQEQAGFCGCVTGNDAVLLFH